MNPSHILFVALCTQISGGYARTDARRIDEASFCILQGRARYEAITHLKVAQRAFPEDAKIRDGLELARAQVIYPHDPRDAQLLTPEAEWYPSTMYSNTVKVVAFIAWSLMCIGIAYWFRTRRKTWFLRTLVLMPIALIPIVSELVSEFRETVNRVSPPIVIGDDQWIVGGNTPLYSGNGREYPIRMLLPRGVECRKIGERGTWVQVEFASGLTGWVEEEWAQSYLSKR